jgi:putative endonuclease
VNIIHRTCERIFAIRKRTLQLGGSHAERGSFGEDRAAEFVRRQLGYRVIVRNWRHQRDEIDLICQDGVVLVFIEVRLRRASALVPAYYSVNAKKKKILLRGCKQYLKRLQKKPKHLRFDVIALALSDLGQYKLIHYPNVALFNKHYFPDP